MRGLGKMFKGAVFIAGLLGLSASASAQQDPRVPVYFDNVAICPAGETLRLGFSTNPATGATVQTATCEKGSVVTAAKLLSQVSLSRPPLFTNSAYDLAIFNNHPNNLGRLYFSFKVTNPIGATNFKIEKVLNSLGFSCYGTTDPLKTEVKPSTSFVLSADVTDITCTSDLTLTSGQSKALTVSVLAPTSGTSLKVAALYGGYEGNSNTGQGCCAVSKATETVLIDSIASGDHTFNTTTFLTSDRAGEVYTGSGTATLLDKLATNIKVPTGWAAQYDIASITERSLPEDGGRCKQSKLRLCQESKVSLPNVVYAPPANDALVCAPGYTGPLLNIELTLDASLLKRKLTATTDLYSAIRVRYDANDDGIYEKTLAQCDNTLGPAEARFPCICSATPTSDLKTIKFLIKNYKNGGFFMD